MTAIYETKDGQQFEHENITRKEKCDFCNDVTGDISDGDQFIQGSLPRLSSEGHLGDSAEICRNCLIEGVTKDQLNEELGSKEELQEETVEL